MIGKLVSKDTVHVLKMEGTWAQVEFDGKQAYVSKKYIMPLRGTKQQSAEDFLVDYGDCLNRDRLVICLY